MRKSINVIIFCGICILMAPISFCAALSNGSYAYNDTDYSYDTDFSSHDWVANEALDKLWGTNQTEWQWLKIRKALFLVGTEAPDNSAISMTLDGQIINGFGDTTHHHVYFNEHGTFYDDSAALRAKSMGDLADVAIDEGKFDAAAYYLGAMTHYIADMSVFAHVAENNVPPHLVYFDEYHSTYEGYIKTRTNEHSDQEEFFKISSFTIGSKKPYNACLDVAWDTYKDPTPSSATTRDAKWFHDNFFSTWKQTYATRADDTAAHQSYYDRVEETLNTAIQGCIDAINYVAGSDSTTSGNGGTIDEVIGGFDIFIIIAVSSFSISIIYLKVRKKQR